MSLKITRKRTETIVVRDALTGEELAKFEFEKWTPNYLTVYAVGAPHIQILRGELVNDPKKANEAALKRARELIKTEAARS